MKENELEKLASVGILIDLPKDFTTSADLNYIDQAISQIEHYQKHFNIEVVILGMLFTGFGTIEKHYRLYTKDKALQIIKKNKTNYGKPITLDWLSQRKEGILKGNYIISNNRIWGYQDSI